MRITIPVLLLTLCWAQAAAAAEYLHPKLKSKAVTIHTVAVLPVKIDVQRNGVKGGESMMRESETVADGVASVVFKVFGALGFSVLEDPVASSGDAATIGDAGEDRRAALLSLQSRFDTLAPQLMAKPKDVRKGRFTLGDEVAGLVPDGADAVVFVRGRGLLSTKAKSFLQGGLLGMALDKGTLNCDLVIVDARSGDVLFLTRTASRGDFVKAAGGQVEKPLSKSLKKLPGRS